MMDWPKAFVLAALIGALAWVSQPAQSQTDSYKGYVGSSVLAPGVNFTAVTPHDSTNLTYYPRGIYVGVTGDVVAVDWDDNAVTFKAVPAGMVLPIRPKRINSTGTTATDLVAVR